MSGTSEGIINVSKALARLVELDCSIKKTTVKHEEQIGDLKQKMEEKLRPMMDEDKGIRAALMAHFDSRKKEIFDDKTKSLKYPCGTVGYRKTPPTLAISGAKTLVARLKQHFKEEVGVYLKTTETPKKEALKNLSAEEMKELNLKLTSKEVFYIELAATATENIGTEEEAA